MVVANLLGLQTQRRRDQLEAFPFDPMVVDDPKVGFRDAGAQWFDRRLKPLPRMVQVVAGSRIRFPPRELPFRLIRQVPQRVVGTFLFFERAGPRPPATWKTAHVPGQNAIYPRTRLSRSPEPNPRGRSPARLGPTQACRSGDCRPARTVPRLRLWRGSSALRSTPGARYAWTNRSVSGSRSSIRGQDSSRSVGAGGRAIETTPFVDPDMAMHALAVDWIRQRTFGGVTGGEEEATGTGA